MYQDLSTCQDWTVKNAIDHLPIMLKGNLKCRQFVEYVGAQKKDISAALQMLLSSVTIHLILITFKILHGLSPAYLSSLLQEYRPPRSLHSSSKSLLTVTTMNSVTHSERALSFCAPTLWNTLPNSLKNAASLSSFKSALKHSYFRNFIFSNEKYYIGFYFI